MREGKLGCKHCGDVGTLSNLESDSIGRGHRVKSEWANCEVSASGSERSKQKLSLRKKMSLHGTSETHVKITEVLNLRSENSFVKSCGKFDSSAIQTTSQCFRTAYQMVKSARPFSGFPNLITLQQENGIDMGRILHSNVTCHDIAMFIAQVMRQKLIKVIVDGDEMFCSFR